MQYEISARYYDELHKNESELLAKSLFHYFDCDNNLNFSILDLGCGTGTVLNELKKLGINGFMQGIDLSTKMIKQATEKNRTIDFQVDDVLEYDNNHESYFDLVLCTHNVINYLRPDSLKVFFSKIFQALTSEGLAFVDFDCKNDFISLWPNYVQTDKGLDWEVCRSNYYDPTLREGTEKQHWKISSSKGNSIEITEIHTLYPISPYSLVEVADSQGLRLLEFLDPQSLETRNEPIDEEITLAGVFQKKSKK